MGIKKIVPVAVVFLTALSMVITFWGTCYTVTNVAVGVAAPSPENLGGTQIGYGLFLGIPSGLVAAGVVWMLWKYLARRRD